MGDVTVNLPERAPTPGELVQLRSRRWVVEQVIPSHVPGQTPIVRLACAEDDAQGQSLEVYWDYEIDRQILEVEGWADLATKGFDPPRQFAAFLNTLRWNCVTATDPNLFQSPFRAVLARPSRPVSSPASCCSARRRNSSLSPHLRRSSISGRPSSRNASASFSRSWTARISRA